MLTRLVAALALVCMACTPSPAATLLPPGEIQFLDNNGQPLSGGKVYFYIPGTSVPKATYRNSAGSVLNSNPVILDSGGRAIIFGSGSYQETLKDTNGNLIWSQVTADTSATNYSWAGTSGGSANAQALTASNFSLGDGQVIGFLAGFTNTGALTVNVNGGSPINVVKFTLTGPTALTGGEVVAGNGYQITYSLTNGNFQLVASPPATTIPVTSITGLGSGVLAFLQSGGLPVTALTGLGTGILSFLQTPGTGVAGALAQPINSASGFLTYQRPIITVLAAGASGTYTTPAGANIVVVEMIGAASGGSGGGTGGVASLAGGDTTFGGLTAHGGAAAPAGTIVAFPAPAAATGGDLNIPGALGGQGGGLGSASGGGAGYSGAGAASFYGGGAPPGIFIGGSGTENPPAATVPGAGGGGGSITVASVPFGWGGNSGAYLSKVFLTPSATYAYSVGSGSAGGAAGTSGGAGSAGGPGGIRVVAYFQ